MAYKKIFLLVTLAVSLTGCEIAKSKFKKKDKETLTEQIVTETFRKGDTVHFTIPKVSLKDTTIYTYNRVGTKIVTRFNKEGKVDSVACVASALQESVRINRELMQVIKESGKEKKEKTSSTFTIGLLVIIAAIIIYAIIRLESYFKYLKRQP